MSSANDPKLERHVLIIEDEKGRRSVALDAATYSLGRDPTNAIVLESRSVSRQHALLLRLPTPGTSLYRYRLVDGNSAGKLSINGITVNGKRVSTLELRSGDTVMFGACVSATYQVMEMGQSEFMKYLDMINYQSIKSLPVSAFETYIGDEGEEDDGMSTSFFPSPENADLAVAAAKSEPKPWWKKDWFKFSLVGVVGMVTGLGIGGGLLAATGQLDFKAWQTSQTPAQSSNPSPAPSSANSPKPVAQP
jgi:hypothetical protein